MMKKTRKEKLLSAIDYIIPVMFVLSMPELYFGLRWISTLLKIATVLLVFVICYRYYGGIHSQFKKIFSVFIAFNCFTIFAYLYNDRPIACYLADISDYILPMFFVFIGMMSKINEPRAFYDRILIAATVVFVLGMVCYVLTPGWYLARMAEASNMQSSVVYDETSILDNMRFRCFFLDSYPVSHYSIFCLSIALFNYYRKDLNNKWMLFCIFVCLIAAVISLHRVALAFGILLITTYLIYTTFNGARKKNRFIIIAIIAGLVIIPIAQPEILDRVNDIKEGVFDRTGGDNMSVSGALKERKFTAELIHSMKYYIFGHGAGSGGAVARRLGYVSVTDMNYVKMFYETGIVGCMFFAYIIIITLLRGLKYYRYMATELGIILFILVAMLGSNSLVIYYLHIVPFWFAIGRIWNPSYLEYTRTNRIMI